LGRDVDRALVIAEQVEERAAFTQFTPDPFAVLVQSWWSPIRLGR
jgi:hypothetical protein